MSAKKQAYEDKQRRRTEAIAKERVREFHASALEDANKENDEEDELDRIRRKRREQMKREHEKAKQVKSVGEYEEIAQDDFLAKVLEQAHTVVHFYHNDFMRCKVMDKHLKMGKL